jgi:hypothetical protein
LIYFTLKYFWIFEDDIITSKLTSQITENAYANKIDMQENDDEINNKAVFPNKVRKILEINWSCMIA